MDSQLNKNTQNIKLDPYKNDMYILGILILKLSLFLPEYFEKIYLKNDIIDLLN